MNSRTCAVIVGFATLAGHRTIGAAEDPVQRAGALLASGRPAEAEAAARTCPDPRCALVLGRALFGLGRLSEAADVAAKVEGGLGPLRAHAEVLHGEALLLDKRPRDALTPLRSAEKATGPAGLRASALLADALLAAGDLAEAHRQADRAAALPFQPADVRTGLAWVSAQAFAGEARASPALLAGAAQAARNFWLVHPEHPAAETARALERDLHVTLPEPSGRELLLRAGRLLNSGHPSAAIAQVTVAEQLLKGADAAEAALLHARALAADGKRSDAAPFLEIAWTRGVGPVAAPAGLLLARDRARRGRDKEAIKLADQLARRFSGAPEADESVLFTARLLADSGDRAAARKRLSKLAASGSGSNAEAARWMLAWMSRHDRLRDAAERFAAFAARANTDEERAQGLYWQARTGKPKSAPALFKRAADLDPLGWYGLLARERLGLAAAAPAPFPPQRPQHAAPPALDLAMNLASLGLLAEAAAEADWYVQHHPGDAGASALPVYERAGRTDRSVVLGETLLGGRGARAPRPILDAAYPIAFPEEVARTAQRIQIDPYLLLAVMRRESLFKPDTRSAAGAVGLLQLLPATARRAAMVLGRPPPRDDELTVPGTAIDLGAWYLAELLGRFGDAAPALAAYNAGPRAAVPWATKGAGQPLDEWVEDIPYRETRRYVKFVIGAWSAYRILSGGSSPQVSATVPAPRSGANF